MPACFHITSFAIIEELLAFSRYRPENSEPANGDSGMNAFLVGAPAVFGQQFGARGARLYFPLGRAGAVDPPGSAAPDNPARGALRPASLASLCTRSRDGEDAEADQRAARAHRRCHGADRPRRARAALLDKAEARATLKARQGSPGCIPAKPEKAAS